MGGGVSFRIFGWFFLAVMVLSNPSRLYAVDDDRPSDSRYSFAIIFENDCFVDTDKAYTNGVFAALSMPWVKEGEDENKDGDFVFSLTDRLSRVDGADRERRKSFAFGQAMVTPDNIDHDIPHPDDFPYAGFLTGKMTVQYQDDQTADSMGILAGMVGPSAQGEWAQKKIHRMIGVADPKGWEYQLKDEFLLNLSYMHKWKLYDTLTVSSGKTAGIDLTVYSGADLGNLMTDVSVGGIVRVGNGANKYPSSPYKGGIGFIPDIGYSRNYPFIINLIGGVEGACVLHSMVLDGNTFKDSPSLDRVPFTADVFAGLGIGVRGMWLSLVMVRGTKTHEKQEDPFTYGSMILGGTF